MVNISDEFLIFFYISAAKYDRKHLENSKIGLENSWIFFLSERVGTLYFYACPDVAFSVYLCVLIMWVNPDFSMPFGCIDLQSPRSHVLIRRYIWVPVAKYS